MYAYKYNRFLTPSMSSVFSTLGGKTVCIALKGIAGVQGQTADEVDSR